MLPRNFVFWNLPQVQYKNPNVQVISFRNMTPSPFIRCYFGRYNHFYSKCKFPYITTQSYYFTNLDSGKQMLIDIDSRSNDEILSHLIKVIGKSKEILLAEEKLAEKKENPANVGVGCERQCICELPGQVPCPAIVPLPFSMRGKYKYQQQ